MVDAGKIDFDNTSRTIVFRAGGPVSQCQTVKFPVFDDTVDEATEGFIIVLDADEPLTMSNQVAFTRNLRTTLGRINDNDRRQFVLIIIQNATYTLLSLYSILLWVHTNGVYI